MKRPLIEATARTTNIVLGAAAIAVLLSDPANAVDLAPKAPPMAAAPIYKAPPMAAVPIYNWTGFYLKGGGGYGMWAADTVIIRNDGSCVLCTPTRQGGRGWFGTVGGGFDVQVSDRWVIGAFADVDFGSIKGNIQEQGPFSVAEAKLNQAWAVGARLGYLITPAVLTYVSGGYTQARFKSGAAIDNSDGDLTGISYRGFSTSGWFAGGGFEYNLGWLPGLFLRSEYRLAQYGTKDFVPCRNDGCSTVVGLNDSTFNSIRFEPWVQTIRTELVWRFNWSQPGRGAY